MKKDLSLILYEKYYSMKNRHIILTTRKNIKLSGTFHGFFKGETLWGEDYIIKWKFISDEEIPSKSIIAQKDILTIQFQEDNSQLNF